MYSTSSDGKLGGNKFVHLKKKEARPGLVSGWFVSFLQLPPLSSDPKRFPLQIITPQYRIALLYLIRRSQIVKPQP